MEDKILQNSMQVMKIKKLLKDPLKALYDFKNKQKIA